MVAPGFLLIEAANVLWKRYRRRELDIGEARRILRDLTRAPLEIHPSEPLIMAALDIAMRHTITAYDGLYLALAAGHRCQLVTADRRLYEICRATEMAPWLVWVGELPGPQG
jgi:predicted nucleic acid-binding protein